jgi:hypothetical protein
MGTTIVPSSSLPSSRKAANILSTFPVTMVNNLNCFLYIWTELGELAEPAEPAELAELAELAEPAELADLADL